MSRDPWAAYWAKGGAGQAGGGCLRGADATIGPVLDALWRAFAAGLKPKARVIDLATGDGAVLRWLKAARAGLDLVGVDSAPALPPAPPGIRLRAGVAMEALPFRDGAFDAATSQFGIEYGDTGRIAAELARVLKPGAAVRFVIHHAASQVVAHNRARRSALAWAALESGLTAKARRLAQARATAALPTPTAFRAAIDEAGARHPDQPVAREFAAAVLEALQLGPPRATIERLAVIEARAAGEIGRIDALETAACDAERVAAIAADFAVRGFGLSEPAVLTERGSGTPFAWLLDGTKG